MKPALKGQRFYQGKNRLPSEFMNAYCLLYLVNCYAHILQHPNDFDFSSDVVYEGTEEELMEGLFLELVAPQTIQELHHPARLKKYQNLNFIQRLRRSELRYLTAAQPVEKIKKEASYALSQWFYQELAAVGIRLPVETLHYQYEQNQDPLGVFADYTSPLTDAMYHIFSKSAYQSLINGHSDLFLEASAGVGLMGALCFSYLLALNLGKDFSPEWLQIAGFIIFMIGIYVSVNVLVKNTALLLERFETHPELGTGPKNAGEYTLLLYDNTIECVEASHIVSYIFKPPVTIAPVDTSVENTHTQNQQAVLRAAGA